MAQPQNLFTGTVHIYQAENGTGKRTIPTAAKLTEHEEKEYSEFCFQNDISKSDFIRNAMAFYKAFYFISAAMMKCKAAIIAFFEKLT